MKWRKRKTRRTDPLPVPAPRTLAEALRAARPPKRRRKEYAAWEQACHVVINEVCSGIAQMHPSIIARQGLPNRFALLVEAGLLKRDWWDRWGNTVQHPDPMIRAQQRAPESIHHAPKRKRRKRLTRAQRERLKAKLLAQQTAGTNQNTLE